MKTNQTERILDYMKRYGSITDINAIQDLGCHRLAARIYDLKQQGYEIVDEVVEGKNRFGEITHFKKYMLADEKIVQENANHIPGY